MRVCIAYDCLFPFTVGGHERWLRLLAEHLVAAGHEVTYLTRQQWDDADPPELPGVRVVAVSRQEPLYDADGNRHAGQGLRFAAGVGRHLAGHRPAYDVVHTCAFPFFHIPALRTALAGTRVPVVVDWPEVWSETYWQTYVGGPAGRAAALLQASCARLSPTAIAFSATHGDRLAALRGGRPPLRLGGLGPDPVPATHVGAAPAGPPGPPRVVFAGRHIREKRAVLAVQAVAVARAALPDLTATVLGDGPEHAAVVAEVARLGLGGVVDVPGFVPAAELSAAVRGATCLLHTSSREGFGIVVLEAAAVGTPVVVVAGPDNAAVELVVPGVNGEVAADDSAATIAAAVVRAHAGGAALRASTSAWYAEQAPRLAASRTATRVEELYGELISAGTTRRAGPRGRAR